MMLLPLASINASKLEIKDEQMARYGEVVTQLKTLSEPQRQEMLYQVQLTSPIAN